MNGRAYKTMLYVGCVVGVYVGAAVAGERGLDESQFSLVTIALLIPALVGARERDAIRKLIVIRVAGEYCAFAFFQISHDVHRRSFPVNSQDQFVVTRHRQPPWPISSVPQP